MRHEVNVWKDPAYEQEPLARLVDEYVLHLNNRAQPISPETVVKYRKSLQAFIASIEAAGEPPVLGSVTKAAVDRWVSQQRLRGLARRASPAASPRSRSSPAGTSGWSSR